MDKNNRRL